jgi:hypothetical protein
MSATASLALDVRGFLAGCDLAKQGIDTVRKASVMGDGGGFAKLQAAAVGAAAAVAALGVAAYKGTMSAIALGARLVDVSYQVGLTARETLALEGALVEFGGKSEDAVPAAKNFGTALKDVANAAPELRSALESAGVSAEKLAPASMVDRMAMVAAAIDGLTHPTQRAAAAAQAFGAAGLRMVEALRPGNIASAAQATATQAGILQTSAGVFARVTQLLGVQGSTLASIGQAVRTKIQGLFVGLASEVAPQLLAILEATRTGGASFADTIRGFSPALAPLADIVEKLVRLDLTGIGQQVGGAVAAIVQAVRSGDAVRYLQLGLQVAAAEFDQQMQGVFSGLVAAGQALFGGLSLAPILDALKTGFFGVANLFVGLLLRGVADALVGLRNMGGAFAALIPADAAAKLLDASTRAKMAGAQQLDQAPGALLAASSEFAAKVGENARAVLGAFKQGREAAMQGGGTETARAEMAAIEARAKETAQNTAATLRAQFATPAAVLPQVTQPAANTVLGAARGEAQAGFAFATSLAKLGGSILGPSAFRGGDDAAGLARQQLEQQREANRKAEQTNVLLKIIADKKEQVGVYQ